MVLRNKKYILKIYDEPLMELNVKIDDFGRFTVSVDCVDESKRQQFPCCYWNQQQKTPDCGCKEEQFQRIENLSIEFLRQLAWLLTIKSEYWIFAKDCPSTMLIGLMMGQ